MKNTEKPHWRVVREAALRGRERIKYNWGWKEVLSKLKTGVSGAGFSFLDGWQN